MWHSQAVVSLVFLFPPRIEILVSLLWPCSSAPGQCLVTTGCRLFYRKPYFYRTVTNKAASSGLQGPEPPSLSPHPAS